MATLSTDTCIRGDQSGLGTASDSETYTVNGSITTSIVSNEATVTGSGGFTSVILGTKTTADINFLVRVEQINNTFDGIGPCFRSDASGANCYFVALYAGSGGLVFAKLTGGGFTSLGTGSFTLSAATFYWVRVVMAGNHLQARIWADGSSEPGTWTIDTTDGTYSSAGRYGVSFNAFSGSGVKFDSITVTDNQSLSTLTRTINPVTAALSSLGLTRTINPATAALQSTLARTINPVSAALQSTLTRTVNPVTAALKSTPSRSITATASIAPSRAIVCTAALSGGRRGNAFRSSPFWRFGLIQ